MCFFCVIVIHQVQCLMRKLKTCLIAKPPFTRPPSVNSRWGCGGDVCSCRSSQSASTRPRSASRPRRLFRREDEGGRSMFGFLRTRLPLYRILRERCVGSQLNRTCLKKVGGTLTCAISKWKALTFIVAYYIRWGGPAAWASSCARSQRRTCTGAEGAK